MVQLWLRYEVAARRTRRVSGPVLRGSKLLNFLSLTVTTTSHFMRSLQLAVSEP